MASEHPFVKVRLKPAKKQSLSETVKNYQVLTRELQEQIQERRLEQNTERVRSKQLERQQKVLFELASMDEPDFSVIIRRITEAVSSTLLSERVSFWMFTADAKEIVCQDLFIHSEKSHLNGMRLSAKDYPRYFEALESARTVAVQDAQKDSRTSEFTEKYLKPLKIVSMMDVSVRLHGKIVGVICHEHVGFLRSWTPEEQNFAASVADLMALSIQTAERLRAEKELAKKTNELLRSNAELEDFARMVSHDLKEPLQKIVGYSSLMVERIESEPQKLAEYAKRIESSALSMNDLIENVLTYSSLSAQKPELKKLELDDTIRYVLSDLEIKIQETNADIRCQSLPGVHADKWQMRRLFTNLVSNAIKFHPRERRPLVEISGETKNGFVKIQVKDHGMGLNAEDAARVFLPFERLSQGERREGHGLGLAICKKIVEQHGGTISLKSQPNKGSVFTVMLPVLKP